MGPTADPWNRVRTRLVLEDQWSAELFMDVQARADHKDAVVNYCMTFNTSNIQKMSGLIW